MNSRIMLFLIMFIHVSCTMEKRIHRPGYHTEWYIFKRSTSSSAPASTEKAGYVHKENENTSPVFQDNQKSDVDYPQLIDHEEQTAINEISENEPSMVLGKSGNFWQTGNVDYRGANFIQARFFEKTVKENFASNASGEPERKLEGFGLAGFILSLGAWFVPQISGLILCLLAIIFGVIGLVKTSRNPDKFKRISIVFAVASLVLGIAGFCILFLLGGLFFSVG